MTKIIAQRMTAKIDGDFVVFLIGMRVNRLWKIHQWLPTSMAMPRMLKELSQHKEMGLLGFHSYFTFPNVMVVQYWRSFDHLVSYASSRDAEHFPAWVAFNRRVGSNGDVGIWHETYQVAAGAYESVYNNMPAFGLGEAGELIPAVGRRSTAAKRFHQQEPAEEKE